MMVKALSKSNSRVEKAASNKTIISIFYRIILMDINDQIMLSKTSSAFIVVERRGFWVISFVFQISAPIFFVIVFVQFFFFLFWKHNHAVTDTWEHKLMVENTISHTDSVFCSYSTVCIGLCALCFCSFWWHFSGHTIFMF